LIKSLLIVFLVISAAPFLLAQDGIVKSFYPDKKLKQSITYVRDILDGTSYYFYPNGNLLSEKFFSQGKLHGVQREFYENGLVKEESYFSYGIRNGLTKTYYENGALKSVAEYELGILRKYQHLDFDSTFIAPLEAYMGNRQNEIKKNIELFICEIESCPKPIGGIEEIQSKIIYPKFAELYGLEGKVNLLATVNNLGDVIKVNILRGIGLGCDEEAERVARSTKFVPGFQNGEAVTADVIFNVEFKLKEKKEVWDKEQIIADYEKEIKKVTAPKLTNTESKETKKIDSSFIKYKQKLSNNFICNSTECAKPRNGLKEILDKFIYPEQVKRLDIKGIIEIEADIDEYGLVRDTKVIAGLGYGADNAAESALYATEFIPAKNNGKEIRTNVKIFIPVNLNLD